MSIPTDTDIAQLLFEVISTIEKALDLHFDPELDEPCGWTTPMIRPQDNGRGYYAVMVRPDGHRWRTQWNQATGGMMGGYRPSVRIIFDGTSGHASWTTDVHSGSWLHELTARVGVHRRPGNGAFDDVDWSPA